MSDHETLQPLTSADLPAGLSWTPGMVDKFFAGYLECALWLSMDEFSGQPMDRNYSPEDIPVAVRRALRAECLDFIARTDGPDLDAYLEERNAAHAGHDFWLMRNGYGAGFWCRGYRRRLAKLAGAMGKVELYVGDDGQVWAGGYEP